MLTASPTETFNQAREAWHQQWHADVRLRAADRVLVSQITFHFNGQHYEDLGELKAWPSWERIAGKARLSIPSIDRGFKKLERIGALEIVRRRDPKTGQNQGNAYIATYQDDRRPPIKATYQDVSRLFEVDSSLNKEEAFVKNPNAPSEGPLKTAEGVDVFIPPAPVKPGFDRAPITYSETWGYVGRPSKVKYPLPEGWRPARALTPREEGRLEAMRVWVTARGVEMADWEAFFTEWLAKPELPNRGDYSNGKSVLAAADRLIDQLGGREAAARYKPGSAGPRQLDFPTHPAGIRSLPKG